MKTRRAPWLRERWGRTAHRVRRARQPLRVSVDAVMVSSAQGFGDHRVTMKEAAAVAEGFRLALVQPTSERGNPEKVSEVLGVGVIVDLFTESPPTECAYRARRMMKSFVKTARYRSSILHFHNPELLVFVPLWRLLGFRHLIFDAHENPAALLTEERRGRIRYLRRPFRFLVRRLTRSTHVVIAEASYRPHFEHARSITEVLNYPRSELIPSTVVEIDGAAPWVRMVYLGRLSPERGLWEVISACVKLRRRGLPVELDLIGPIAPGLQEDFLRVVDDVGGVVWHGPRPAPEAWSMLAEYDVGIAVLHDTENYRESFPTKIPEYLLAGLVVITSDFPLYREVVGCRDALFVTPGSSDSIAEAVSRLTPDDFTATSRNDRRARASERFTWESQALHLVGLYRRLSQQRMAR
jgi:glycosyltransferase involved in cell wall biosynthesis